jgi:DNA-binding MarR family transcriptional regulator
MNNNSKRLHVTLISTYSAHRKCCIKEFQKLNLSNGQPKILSILYQHEGYLQKDLAERAHVEPSTMTSILNNMENNGLIYKKPVYVSGGKRANAIFLTDKGHIMSVKVNKIVDDMEELSFQGFSDHEKHLLIDLLDRIKANLQNN